MTDCPLKDRDLVFCVSYLDIPLVETFSVDSALESSRDGSVRNMNGKLIHDKSIDVEGNPGREFVARAKGGGLTGNQSYLYQSRIFVANSRFYMVSATFPEKMDKSDEIKQFFDSFALL